MRINKRRSVSRREVMAHFGIHFYSWKTTKTPGCAAEPCINTVVCVFYSIAFQKPWRTKWCWSMFPHATPPRVERAHVMAIVNNTPSDYNASGAFRSVSIYLQIGSSPEVKTPLRCGGKLGGWGRGCVKALGDLRAQRRTWRFWFKIGSEKWSRANRII